MTGRKSLHKQRKLLKEGGLQRVFKTMGGSPKGNLGTLKNVFYVTCNNISVTLVTAHRCAGGPKKLYLRSASKRHRHFVWSFKMTVNCSVHVRTPGSVQEPEVRPGAREESASPAWLATPAKNAHNPANMYV